MKAIRSTLRALMAAAFLLAPANLSGQARAIVFGGLAVSELDGDGVSGRDFGTRNGYHIGITAEISLLGSLVKFAPGGIFAEKGYSDGPNSSVNLSYLNVVAPLWLSVPVAAGFGVSLFGGPGFALGFGCTMTSRSDGVESSINCSNADLGLRSTDLGALLGAGISYALPNATSLLLNAALDRSLTSIDSTQRGDIRNRSFFVNAGLSFPLSR